MIMSALKYFVFKMQQELMPQNTDCIHTHTHTHTHTQMSLVNIQRIHSLIPRGLGTRLTHTYMYCTCMANQVGIVLMWLAFRVVCNRIVAITEVVRIVTAHKVHSAVVRSGEIAISLRINNTSKACEVKRNNTDEQKITRSTQELTI